MALNTVFNKNAHAILDVVHYACPIILLFFFLFAFTLRSILTAKTDEDDPEGPQELGPGGKPLPRKKRSNSDQALVASLDFSRPRKLFFIWVSAGVCATFLGHAANVIIHALAARKEGWWCGKPVVIYIVGSFFVYSLLLISLVDSHPSPTTAHLSTWTIALVMEIILLSASLALYTHKHQEPQIRPSSAEGRIRDHMTDWEAIEILLDWVRVALIGLLVAMYLGFVVSRNKGIRDAKAKAAGSNEDEETTGLLSNGSTPPNGSAQNGHAHGPGQANGYGTAATGGKHRHTEGAPPGWERPTTAPSRSWWEYIRGYGVFFPYVWPTKDRRLQILASICMALVAMQRVVNFLVPLQTGVIVDALSESEGTFHVPWLSITFYILLRLLSGNNGLLGALRGTLWIPVSQYSYREISIAAFEHVHSLSLDFHLGKKTGEVLSALGKGSSINTFLEQVTFQVLPMLIDLGVAMGFFLIKFDAYYALVVAIVTFWYIYLTIRMAQWRADIRRQMVNADREEDAVKNDSMVSYETVKYFNAEPWEFKRYQDAVAKYQKAEYKVLYSLNIMNVSQNMVFMVGLLVMCFIMAYQVVNGRRSVGDFTTLLAYMTQLQSPLNFFGTFYRMIQSAMINSERMLELFKERPSVVDAPHVTHLPTCEGGIAFNDVEFAYDERKPALKGLDFKCKPGQTTALVGESGGGKSTVFRLLFRFYNQQSGSIQLDSHDVQDITIDSLRQQISVVPQDTVLFNESLMYNLKYARQNATDEDVYAACKAASIHDKILAFPDGYNTKVGERGLRLSGGEKQRVAIARAVIKNPRIILLDEATAALDTDTEEAIQRELKTLGQGRTMLIIAHRLSTITHADQILVLHDGKVSERGTHEELLALKGMYAGMWAKQVRAQQFQKKAKEAQDRYERLQEGQAVSASQSEDEGGSPPSRHHPHHRHHATNSSGEIRPPSSGLVIAHSADHP